MIHCPSCGVEHGSTDWRCPQCGSEPERIDGFLSWAPALAKKGGGFEPTYFADLAPAESSNFWFRARNELIVWALRRYFQPLHSFLEIGCGTGFVLSGIAKAFPGARLTGTEVFSAALGFAAARLPQATLMQMDARSIPFVDEFDVVGAFDVIEHIAADEEVVGQLSQAVRPGGGVMITVPQHPWLWSSTDDYARHVRRYTACELHTKLERAGLEILRSTSFVSLLLPLLWLSRRRGMNAKAYDPLDEYRIPRWVNRSLEGVLNAESLLIRSGISFALGGSRLVVARKRIA
jgi:SAM-dependent methyltransferase